MDFISLLPSQGSPNWWPNEQQGQDEPEDLAVVHSSRHQKDLCSNPASAPCCLLTLAGYLNSLSPISFINS